MGKRWASVEQLDFLNDQKNGYLKAALQRRFEPFLATLYEAWFERWSERQHLFGDPAPDSPCLTKGQNEELGKAIEARKLVFTPPNTKPLLRLHYFQQLKRWMRWNCNSFKVRGNRHSNGKNPLAAFTGARKRTRRSQPVEIYSRLYYNDRIKPRVTAQINATVPEIETGKERSARIQGIRKVVTKTMWDEECDEIRQEVEKLRMAEGEPEGADVNSGDSDSEEVPVMGDGGKIFSPRQYQGCVQLFHDKLIVLTGFSWQEYRFTGWDPCTSTTGTCTLNGLVIFHGDGWAR